LLSVVEGMAYNSWMCMASARFFHHRSI